MYTRLTLTNANIDLDKTYIQLYVCISLTEKGEEMIKRKCVFAPVPTAHLQLLYLILAIRYATCQERANEQSISLLISHTCAHSS